MQMAFRLQNSILHVIKPLNSVLWGSALRFEVFSDFLAEEKNIFEWKKPILILMTIWAVKIKDYPALTRRNMANIEAIFIILTSY